MGSGSTKGRLRVRASATGHSHDFRVCDVNYDEHPFVVDNEHFAGKVFFRVQGFSGITSDAIQRPPRPSSDYFGGKRRLFSLQAEGVFKHPVNGDDLILAADFDQPLSPVLEAFFP